MTIKTTYWAWGIVMVGLLVFGGCRKSDKTSAQRPPASVALQNLRQAFPTPTAEQQNNISKTAQAIRYRLYPNAVAALTQLSGDASLTDAQKKAVSDLMEGIKQLNAAAAPAQ